MERLWNTWVRLWINDDNFFFRSPKYKGWESSSIFTIVKSKWFDNKWLFAILPDPISYLLHLKYTIFEVDHGMGEKHSVFDLLAYESSNL